MARAAGQQPSVWKCQEPGCTFSLKISAQDVDTALERINEHKYEHARAKAPETTPSVVREENGKKEEKEAPAIPQPQGEDDLRGAVKQLIDNNNQVVGQFNQLVGQFKQMGDVLVALAQRVQNLEGRGTNNPPQYIVPPVQQAEQQQGQQGGMAAAVELARLLGIGQQANNPIQSIQNIRNVLDAISPITNWVQQIELGGYQRATDIFSRGVRGGISAEAVTKAMQEEAEEQRKRLQPPPAASPSTGQTA